MLLFSFCIATWMAVVFVVFWIRHGDDGDESMFYNTSYLRWQGLVAMDFGLVVSVYLFANDFGLYVGPIPTNNPDVGDITFIAGFVITGVLYYVFNLGLRKQTSDTRATIGSKA